MVIRLHQFWNRLLLTAATGFAFGFNSPTWGDPIEADAPSASSSQPVFTRIDAETYQLGSVRLNKKEWTITFPGEVNMADGMVEYALVHGTGKVHESVLKTSADPFHIHLAKLLLSPAPEQRAAPESATPRELLGERISLWISWSAGQEKRRVRLEELISNTLTKAPMTRGDWVYSGSRVVEGTFLAQRDGSIVTIIADPDALINNPRPGRNDDEIWKVNSSVTPPVGTPVEVKIQLPITNGTK